jgi:uncharacterized sulfatase
MEIGHRRSRRRRQVTRSAFDVHFVLESLGYNGSQSWLTGDLATMYGQRLNLLPMLQSAGASGRRYLVSLRTAEAKLGVYADWVTGTTDIKRDSIQFEYYDYQTPDGRLETENRNHDPTAYVLLDKLLTDVLPNERRAPFPPASSRSRRRRKLGMSAMWG